MNIEDLVQRIETAPGPSERLDTEIVEALGGRGTHAPFTASVDAALSLVPPGWSVHQLSHHNDCHGHFTGWVAELYRPDQSVVACPAAALVASAALALCAAALRVTNFQGIMEQPQGNGGSWRRSEVDEAPRALQ